MDASLNTLVVSWKEAAEIKLSVPSDAWVIPCKIGLETAAVALRVIPTIFYNPHHDSKQPPWYMIPCVHLGQICNAAVGPLVMATCTLLSATWFPSNERGTATSIAVIANNSKFFL